ncbi:DUF5103 domain-containing protein [Aequorivita xiaoshiensis]|uniref:DUF5103 domain-containing protein n=1 Tax=Aequorivita xiaoshiensis TaxID=2874476 RepID=A0A9X1R3L9_9FLAO|nr:DUF5103 domain-containing protein [Aequorivita xiaoshiensis]MCG2430943.1 DUF5103 domain-containing protein [Aequorivita xiaoshiensis]
MLKSFTFSLIFFFIAPQISAQITEKVEPSYIQTVQFKGATELSELPIIRLGQSLELTFDALNGEEADYFYRITHHNFDWTPSDLSKSEYLDGFDDVRITEYQNSLNTLQIYSHYKLTIPNRDTRTIKKSGNYLLSIFSSNGDLIFTRKFLVVEDIASVGVEIKRARDLNVIDEKQVVQFTVNSQSLLLRNPKQSVKTLVLQNSNLKTAITDLVPQYTMGNELIYKYDKEAAFGGGNEFLAFDNKDERSASNGIRSIAVTDLYENYLFTNIPRYNRPYTYNPDINGNFVVRNIDARDQDIEAEYVRMHFNLQYYEDLGDKEIHVYGNFNNWTIDESTYLRYDSESDSYRNTRLFKQGFYNYKYVIVNRDGSIDEGAISGDFWQTENDYTVVVYFRDLGARYDRIIGIGRANSTSITNN